MDRFNIDSPYAQIVNTPAILNTLLMISMIGSLGIGVVYTLASGMNETSYSLGGLAGFCGILMYFHRRGFHTASGVGLFVVISFVLTYNISTGHAIFDEAMLAYPLLIVFSGLVFGKRTTTIVTLITIAQMTAVFLLAEAGKVQPFDGAIELGLEETITTSVILGATGILVWVVVDIIENAVEKINAVEQDLDNAYELTLEAWARALELRGRENTGHNAQVTTTAERFAAYIGLDSEMVQNVKYGALLHDIGKMGIPENILLKTTDLETDEIALLRTHPVLAENIVKRIDYLHGALDVISCHHERFDGKGYPKGLIGNQIPIDAQLFSIVDCWDVLQSTRPCREEWTEEETINYIQNQSGKKFNPDLVSDFIRFIRSKEDRMLENERAST